MKRPNILYIHSHDTGRYIQPYGYAVPTPNMQALAEQGVLFRQAFCAAPTCSASRAAMLTGQSAHNSGMLGLAHRGFGLYDYKQHVVHTLKQAGYSTTLIGAQHEARDVSAIGYDRVVKVKAQMLEVAPHAVEFLKSAPKQPFFLAVGCADTHRAFRDPQPPDDPRYCRPPEPIPDTPQSRHEMAGFIGHARDIDTGYGMVFEALKQAGLENNTLVICTTDHGVAWPHMKCNLYDHGLGVLLIMRGPGGFDGGKVVDAMVSHVDVFPTICEAAGIERPAWLQGKSIVPLVRGEVAEINEEIYGEVTFHAAYEPMRCVRTKRYKYIRRFENPGRPVMANCDDGLSKDCWVANGWREQAVPDEELFDLIFDPIERNNLAARSDLAGVLADMRRRLDAWMRRTDDPLLKGHVPPPEGARVSLFEDLSPRDIDERVQRKTQ